MENRKGIARGVWLLSAVALLIVLAGCGGTASAPGSESQPSGAGLSGEMAPKRGVILGNIGIGDQAVNLFLSENETCDTAGAAPQTTTSDTDGNYAFSQPVDEEKSYCIEYGGETHICNCEWSDDSCTCSPTP